MGHGADLRLSAAVSQFSTFSISSFPPPALADSAPFVLFVAARGLEVRGQRLWVMEPISGFQLPFPNFLLSQFLLFRRLP